MLAPHESKRPTTFGKLLWQDLIAKLDDRGERSMTGDSGSDCHFDSLLS